MAMTAPSQAPPRQLVVEALAAIADEGATVATRDPDAAREAPAWHWTWPPSYQGWHLGLSGARHGSRTASLRYRRLISSKMTRAALATSAAEPMTEAIMMVSPIVGILLGRTAMPSVNRAQGRRAEPGERRSLSIPLPWHDRPDLSSAGRRRRLRVSTVCAVSACVSRARRRGPDDGHRDPDVTREALAGVALDLAADPD